MASGKKLSIDEWTRLADFRYQVRRFLRFSETLTRENGVSPLQYLLLLQLKGTPGRDWASIGDLAERLQAKHHGVVALVSRCEAAGWVRRIPGRTDGRVVEVHLTGAGKRCVERLASLHRDELRSLQSGFTVAGISASDQKPSSVRRDGAKSHDN